MRTRSTTTLRPWRANRIPSQTLKEKERGRLGRILSFRVNLVRMPLLSPFSNSGGTVHVRSGLILRLKHGGVEAFSECATDDKPSSTKEDNAGALLAIRDMASTLLWAGDPPPPHPREFLDSVESGEAARRGGHQPMASAAIEMLLWDYAAKRAGVPLDELLGESRSYTEVGIAIGLGDTGETRAAVGAAVARGYKRIKVKIDRGGALGRLEGIRESYPRIPLCADANGCFDLQRDGPLLRRIDDFALQYIEQPLAHYDDACSRGRARDLLDHAKLAQEISTPICLDESITTIESAKEALDLGAAGVINIKPGRVGGLGNAVEIGRIARARGAHTWIGGMLETGVGRAFNVALASQRWVDYPGDTSPNERYFARDIVKNPFEMRDGVLRPNGGAGIGITIDKDVLAEATQATWTIF
jgi:O-succinylbenzoate synthase